MSELRLPEVEGATLAMIPRLADIHMEAYGKRLGGVYVRAMLRKYIHESGAFLLVQKGTDGVVAGYASCAMDDVEQGMQSSLVPLMVLCTLVRPWILAKSALRQVARRRISHFFAESLYPVHRELPVPCGIFVSLAVASAYRGQGVGRRLFVATQRLAVSHGMRSLRSSVRYDNDAVLRLYCKDDGWFVLGQDADVLMFGKRLEKQERRSND